MTRTLLGTRRRSDLPGPAKPWVVQDKTQFVEDVRRALYASKMIAYSQGFDAIDPTDLRGRFRWWGLYTQRRPGIAGGRTGALDDADIEDAYFMMRVRIPGGQLSAHQLRTVAGIAKEYGRDLADITDRQNVQFHWIRIEDVPEIWARLEEVGLSSLQACGDVPRNILGCPVAGIDGNEVIDATAALRATETVAALLGRRHA